MGLRRCVEHVVGQCGSGADFNNVVEDFVEEFGGDFVEDSNSGYTSTSAASAACSGEGWATAAIDATAYGGDGFRDWFEASGL